MKNLSLPYIPVHASWEKVNRILNSQDKCKSCHQTFAEEDLICTNKHKENAIPEHLCYDCADNFYLECEICQEWEREENVEPCRICGKEMCSYCQNRGCCEKEL